MIIQNEVASITVPGKNIKVYAIPGNATMQDYIQVVNATDANNPVVVKNYERYNVLEDYKLVTDTTLLLILRDTTRYMENKPDTFLLDIK